MACNIVFLFRGIMYHVVEISTFNIGNITRLFTLFDEIIAFSILSRSPVINTIFLQRREVKTTDVCI